MTRKALVTGGTRGIGFAIAQLLLETGCEVLVTGTKPNGKGPAGTSYFCCDFSDRSSLQNFAKDLAKLSFDILVNNAGINKVGLLSDYPFEDFENTQQVNVTAPFLLCQAVIPGMGQRKFGRIVNIASIFSIVGKAGRSAYATSKFGLLGLSRTLSLEVAKDNVLVNCVAPGLIDTEMSHKNLGERGIAAMIKKIPLGRMAKPEEIARVVRFLVSEENTYITGQTIIVDGGYTCE